MASDELKHYGTPRHSGRYPWGSGDTPYQRSLSFRGHVQDLRNKGVKDTEIAKGMGMNTTELRKRMTLADNEIGSYESAEAFRLYEKGYSKSAIARRMGRNESSIRSLLNPALRARRESANINAKLLQDAVDQNDGLFIDIGKGSEYHMGITAHKLKTAVSILEEKGYVVYGNIPVQQQGTGQTTNIKVLCPPGTTWKEVVQNKEKIKMVNDVYSEDGGRTGRKVEPPRNVDSNRILVRHAGEEGGDLKDGIIELRRGVPDISLKDAKYAQVRIAVDGTHYIKGVAVHSDDIPDGIDIVFNTNKKPGTPVLGASDNTILKPMKKDPDNPFGASIKQFDEMITLAQRHYKDENGVEHLSALNIVNEEGDWSKWTKSLASQMLSKQNPALAKKQLDESYAIAKEEFNEIMSLTNPTIRASLLEKFAGQCDSDATHLKAAALPRQSTKVLLPFPTMNESEVYAPNYHDGEQVALIRYPHGGIFEIPILRVNSKNTEAKALIGNARDAIGINPSVAKRLSGADFDGDTVIVIPIGEVNIKTSSPLKGLKDFDPKEAYPPFEGMKRMTKHGTGTEMGKISNLITDMTIKGAVSEEICKAVRHSMVVIDAEKHGLNYKQSFIDNGIAELKRKYQGRENAGAATLLSKSTSDVRVKERKEKAPSKMTPEELSAWKEGKVIWEYTGKTYKKIKELKRGGIKEIVLPRTQKTQRMMEEENAYALVSGSPSNTTRIESIYANYANSMKALANSARKEARLDQNIPYSPSAAKTYEREVESLRAALRLARMNAPLERQAQLIAGKAVASKLRDNPEFKNDYEHKQRLKGLELQAARIRIGAKKASIWISDREWEAISAGAVHKTFLKDILKESNIERVRQLATPRSSKGMSPGKIARAKTMLSYGHSQADVADVLGVSVSTLINSVK